MHSSAKSPGLPGESQDERLTHIQGGGGGVHGLELLQTHKNHIYTVAQTSTQSHTFMHAPCSPISCLPHCSVSQDGFSAVIHSRDSLFPEWVTHAGL